MLGHENAGNSAAGWSQRLFTKLMNWLRGGGSVKRPSQRRILASGCRRPRTRVISAVRAAKIRDKIAQAEGSTDRGEKVIPLWKRSKAA